MMPPIRPEAEIKFAARSGFLTKMLWNEFFASGGERWRRKYWRLLTDRGFFKHHPSARAQDVIVLNPKNELVRYLVDQNVSASPVLNQLLHDELMARAILLLRRSGLITNYQFELELKKAQSGSRPRNRSEENKYPDALVELPNGLSIAIELELTQKSQRRYRKLLRTYQQGEGYDVIVFVVRSSAIFNCITKALREVEFSIRDQPIGFCWLHDWTIDPTQARIVCDSYSTSISELAPKTYDNHQFRKTTEPELPKTFEIAN